MLWRVVDEEARDGNTRKVVSWWLVVVMIWIYELVDMIIS